MNNWYGRDRYNNDRNMQDRNENWTRRPSERYDREEYYRNNNPDHYSDASEDYSFRSGENFEGSGPYYNYGTQERDLMHEGSSIDYRSGERHPDPYIVHGYDRGYSRSQYGYPNQHSYHMTQRSGDMDRHLFQSNYSGRGPKGWKRSDENIKDQVCHMLELNPHIDATEIEVDVKDGIVTLKGNIHDRPAKRLAEDIIAHLPGVNDVHNLLTIDKTFFQRAKEFFVGESDSGAVDTPSPAGKPEKNPRH